MQHSELTLSRPDRVASARGAKEWLRDLPLSDPASAHQAVAAFLAEVAEGCTGALARLEILEILETVRGHVAEIDDRYAQRYAGKPLPFGQVERNAFARAQELWRTLATLYLDCFEAALGEEPGLLPHKALCLARAGGYLCDALIGHYRAGQAGVDDLVEDLQKLVDLAAEHALLNAMVRDSLHPRGATSVARIYRRALLIGLAGTAAVGREREAMFELAHWWESKTAYTALPAEARRELRREDLPPAAAGERRQRLRVVRLGRWTHIVDVTRLSRSLRRRMSKLDAGNPVDAVRLPDPFRQVSARDVLARLHHVWCDQGEARREPRAQVAPGDSGTFQAVGLAYAGVDFEAMYYMVAGATFDSGEPVDMTSRRRFDELFVFQHAPLERSETRIRNLLCQFEDWEIGNRSEAGLNLRRARAGARFRVDQLVAMRLRLAGDDGPVVLAQVRWLAEPGACGQVQPGALEAGVEVLAGKPHGVGVRLAGAGRGRESPYIAAFRLGSLHAQASVTLVVPIGWFKPDRELETRDAGIVYRLRVTAQVRRGCDFEVVSAQIAG